MEISRSTNGGFTTVVTLDLAEAKAQGDLFFAAYERAMVAHFRRAMLVALKAAQQFAPKGEHNYDIEDLDERTRAGGSRTSTVASQRGFAVDAASTGKHRIRKVPGGALRRALQLAIEAALSEEMLTGHIGVASGSPAEAYARITELGGTIAAKRAKYLRFSPDGHTIIFKPVVHRDPHPYLLPALIYAWPEIQKVPQLAFEQAAAEMGMAL